jgi:hypothetical protein
MTYFEQISNLCGISAEHILALSCLKWTMYNIEFIRYMTLFME